MFAYSPAQREIQIIGEGKKASEVKVSELEKKAVELQRLLHEKERLLDNEKLGRSEVSKLGIGFLGR